MCKTGFVVVFSKLNYNTFNLRQEFQMVLDAGQANHFIGSVPLELRSLGNVILFFGADMTSVM